MSLYLFDMDGTLITGYMDNPGKEFDIWQLLPDRSERLAELIAAGHKIAIITNQGGVAWGFVTPIEVDDKIYAVANQLRLPEPYHIIVGPHASPKRHIGTCFYVCYADTRGEVPAYTSADAAARRKPAPAMIFEAMRDLRAQRTDVVMIGDRPEDQAAAAAADVAFVWADDFFQKQEAEQQKEETV